MGAAQLEDPQSPLRPARDIGTKQAALEVVERRAAAVRITGFEHEVESPVASEQCVPHETTGEAVVDDEAPGAVAAQTLRQNRRLARHEGEHGHGEFVLSPSEERAVEVDESLERPSSVALGEEQMPRMDVAVQKDWREVGRMERREPIEERRELRQRSVSSGCAVSALVGSA